MESVRDWSVADLGGFLGRAAVLTVIVYVLARFPATGVGGLVDPATPHWLVVTFGTVVALGYVTVRSRWTGWKLAGALAALYAGLQVVSFLELSLYGLESAAVARSNALLALAAATATVAVVVVGFGRARGEEAPPPDDRLSFGLAEWAWKLPLLAVLFLLAMILGGLVLFGPVAQFVDPVAYEDYEILDPPAWVLPFQLVRGLVFTALLLPVVSLFRGGYRETQVAVALLFAWLLSWGMLVPGETIPGLLWVAHFVEVFVSMAAYGLVLVPLVFRSHQPLRWIRAKTDRARARRVTK